ncbi:MAG: radical SAM protein [Erythrobacter sp.]|nr:radical SAM protein [Erythrobacter sp.]
MEIQPATGKSLRHAPDNIPDELADIIEYRKSGLSLNHVIGCPLDCAYCVRHLFANYNMKRPHLVMNDEDAVKRLVSHWAFQPNITPIQVFNRATDPFLPGVKDHLMRTLELLDARKLTNHVLVITRWKVLPADVERLERLGHIRVTILVTWSGITDKRLEPVDSTIAEQSLATLAVHAKRTKRILYWRPLIGGINDSDHHIERANRLAAMADATVFTGLFHRAEIRDHLASIGAETSYVQTPRRKILPQELERRVINRFSGSALFRKTSCGVAFAHGVADYNGHYGIREICDICPASQLEICANQHEQPDKNRMDEVLKIAGLERQNAIMSDGYISVQNSEEQQRYYIQHSMCYQVHDRALPHHPNRHGRAEEGWE